MSGQRPVRNDFDFEAAIQRNNAPSPPPRDYNDALNERTLYSLHRNFTELESQHASTREQLRIIRQEIRVAHREMWERRHLHTNMTIELSQLRRAYNQALAFREEADVEELLENLDGRIRDLRFRLSMETWQEERSRNDELEVERLRLQDQCARLSREVSDARAAVRRLMREMGRGWRCRWDVQASCMESVG